VHKWLSIIIGIQILIWVLSGTIISLLDHNVVSGRATFSPLPPTESIGPIDTLYDPSLLVIPDNAKLESIELTRTANKLSYRVTSALGVIVFDAYSGEALRISEQQAQTRALQSYRGIAKWDSNEFLAKGSEELAAQHGQAPQWRIKFDDSINTRVYISGIDGRVLAHRNNYSQLVDFLLMLHFMDYADQHSFNNLQIRLFGFAALCFAISGLLLLKSSFSRRDFSLKGLRK
jgi:hypothetical protein